MGRRRKKKQLKIKIKSETIQSVVAIISFALSVLVILSFTGNGAFLGAVNNYLVAKIGLGTLFLPFVLLSSGFVFLHVDWEWAKPNVLLGTLLLMIGTVGLTQSGELGAAVFANLSYLISSPGTVVVFTTLITIGVFIVAQLSITELIEVIQKLMEKRRLAKEIAAEKAAEEAEFKTNEMTINEQASLEDDDPLKPSEKEVKQAKRFSIPRLSLFSSKAEEAAAFNVNDGSSEKNIGDDTDGTALDGAKPAPKEPTESQENSDELTKKPSTQNPTPMVWEYPPLSILSAKEGGKAERGDVKENAALIENTLDSFGIKAKVAEVNYGPSVTQYALDIARGTKLSKITNLATDLALALAAPTGQIRIEAPIPGRSLVGIEVPNQSPQYVTLRQMLGSSVMKKQKSKLAVSLGIDVSGKPVIVDISTMPHVLIAGATGSGKSVCINTFMSSILFRASPDEVKFILVDPKRVELTGYNDIPHLLTPVIVDPAKVVSALKWATDEMDKRYKQLADVGVKNIAGYNELAGFAAMPNIVIVIDEMADIMMFAPNDVEESITRLAQMARAVGIHLVLATQRPSVDVITGLIKANIPTRIAFNVSSMSDSRVIMDLPGAEKLLGKGDMLFLPRDKSKPSRVQGTFVSDKETRELVEFIKNQGKEPDYIEDVTKKFKANQISGGSGGGGEDRDELFDEAVKLIAKADKASSSMLQRKLSVGYARAARILDQLFEAGMVTPPDGSKPRDIIIPQIQQYMTSQSSE